jgi:hypothetical protein
MYARSLPVAAFAALLLTIMAGAVMTMTTDGDRLVEWNLSAIRHAYIQCWNRIYIHVLVAVSIGGLPESRIDAQHARSIFL